MHLPLVTANLAAAPCSSWHPLLAFCLAIRDATAGMSVWQLLACVYGNCWHVCMATAGMCI